jgi:hypothetical protein
MTRGVVLVPLLFLAACSPLPATPTARQLAVAPTNRCNTREAGTGIIAVVIA